jgi:hypothetical protein
MFKDTHFTPLRLGAMQLPNRIIMAPLTRMRRRKMHERPMLSSSAAHLVLSRSCHRPVSDERFTAMFRAGVLGEHLIERFH